MHSTALAASICKPALHALCRCCSCEPKIDGLAVDNLLVPASVLIRQTCQVVCHIRESSAAR